MSRVFTAFCLAGFACFLFVSSCVTPYGMQTAKTLEKGELEVVWDASAGGMFGAEQNSAEALAVMVNPGLGFGFRFGSERENWDWGLHFDPIAALGGDVKYQFAGDRESAFAAATGLNLGISPSFSVFGSSWRSGGPTFATLGIPFYATFDAEDRFTLTFGGNYLLHASKSSIGHSLAGSLNISVRVNNEGTFKRYIMLEVFYGQSLGSSNLGYDRTFLAGGIIGYRYYFDNGRPAKKPKRSGKKKEHRVLYEW